MMNVSMIDSHLLLVESLEALLRLESDFQFAGAATSLAKGMDLVSKTPTDILMIEPFLPDGDGFEIINHLKVTRSKTAVIVLTRSPDNQSLLKAVNNGCRAFLSKDCSLTELLLVLRRVAAGEVVLPVERMADLVRNISRQRTIFSPEEQMIDTLTPREMEILRFLVQGKSSDAISAELNIAPLTVRTHIRNMMSKLGVHSRLEAVSYAINTGMVQMVQ